MIRSINETATLHNEVKMPWLGLGVFQSEEGREVEQAVQWALELGYRSIDTASIYGNEAGVGKAIKESGVPREDIFLTTKVWNTDQGFNETLDAFEASIERLQQDYIDLYLIHWPVQEKYKETWRALEQLYNQGRVRAIGVSNFLVHHLKDLLTDCEIVPMINQVEFHPRLVQPTLLDFCRTEGIQVEAWSPIMRGKVLEIPELLAIAEKYNKTAVQIVLRWDIQHNVVTIPKSSRKDRLTANKEIFDFELTDEEMTLIDSLDRNERVGPDPDNFNF
jgi:diketogulonate reductase-like aldo/keto reductase